ncbi:MAG: DEAD/DEAH box helicase [Planctomycetota bacterium]
MLVLHACWMSGALRFWAESASKLNQSGVSASEGGAGHHPFAADADGVAEALSMIGVTGCEPGELRLRLPVGGNRPEPSTGLAAAVGFERQVREEEDEPAEFNAPALVCSPDLAVIAGEILGDALDTGSPSDQLRLGDTLGFAAAASGFVRHLLSQHRFVPMLLQEPGGDLSASWRPWLADDHTSSQAALLVRAMPPAFRAGVDSLAHHPWAVLDDMIGRLGDAECRRVLRREEMYDTVEDRDPDDDAQIAWLHGLLGNQPSVPVRPTDRPEAVKQVRRWIGLLEERGASSNWKLCLRLNEPVDTGLLEDLQAPPTSLMWTISFHLRAVDSPEVMLDAADIWALGGDSVSVEGLRADNPQELLLAELGRAARLYKPLESALSDPEPIELPLETQEAYRFLREIRPLLIEQGVSVEVPDWWESPSARLGARLKLDDPPGMMDEEDGGSSSSSAAAPELGLDTLIGYRWEIAVGEVTLSLHEFEKLAERGSPLVRVNGKWVEIRPEDVKAAVGFIGENPGGEMALGEALRLAYASDAEQTGVPVLGLEAGGWLGALIGGENRELPDVEAPSTFKGTLRPYQQRGLSWMAFLETLGFGLCLADDMGLGKTIQLLALAVYERQKRIDRIEAGANPGEPIGPTLLIVPMSVVGNWVYEAARFAPSLRVHVHHGPERPQGDDLRRIAVESDIIVTTYALANRDHEDLKTIAWHRVVLDEAQCIKNPQAKQSRAVRDLQTQRRIALTGTPVENRLTELWSIMDFLNPGYLGPASGFRKRFSVPIERHRDKHRAEQLRGLVRPFVLRRLKTDPDVVGDLPEKLESKEFCHLTSEQASLYEATVNRMLSDVSDAEGIHRRGLVLSTLIRLKQICNHPAQLLKDHDPSSGKPPDPKRSGKCIRILEMLDEVLAEGHKALVFTQFRQMGHLLSLMLRQNFDREILFLHGGVPQKARQRLVEQFHEEGDRHPILLLSLKAGGVGLNLTAASHVFHFDRWWNPAVEDQATDRAYRIGQTKTVQVHKYVVRGTLEERIDDMIERKTELARNIIGAGERWLTELDTDRLREILTLRHETVGDE